MWDAPIRDYGTDLKKLHAPQFAIDWETTNGSLALARDVFGKILSVELKGIWWWSLGVTLPAATLRGLQNILCDFVDHPDELKELLAIISAGLMEKLDYLEAHNLLTLNNDGTYVGSGGFGFTDELPQRDFAGRVRSRGHVGLYRKPGDRGRLARRCTANSSSPAKSRSWIASA